MINEETIKNLLNEKSLTAREIIELGNLDIDSRRLARELQEYDYINVIRCCKPHKYKITIPLTFTGKIEKDKNLLKMELDNGDYVVYDFNKKDFTNITPHCQSKGIENNIILEIFCNEKYKNLQEIEWLYSYIDLLDTDLDNLYEFDYSTCPSGYIKWLRDNNLKINDITIKNYILKQTYPYIPLLLLTQWTKERNYYFDKDTILEHINYIYKQCNIDKIIKNSVKKYEWHIEENLFELTSIINYCIENDINWCSLIDDNRTLIDNTSTLENMIKEQKNKLLTKNLQKLNFLNNLEINDYIIVIPQTIEDLILEGKQQNNCVGHYYNDSIIDGANLIYFMRDKNNINNSIVTCRYNIKSKKTVEHRIKNNYSTTTSQNNIIQQIDKIINENLENMLN